jgi:hypothetical protein
MDNHVPASTSMGMSSPTVAPTAAIGTGTGTGMPAATGNSNWDFKTWVIVVLLVLVVFSALGGQFLAPLMSGLQSLVQAFASFVNDVLVSLGKSTGIILSESADAAGQIGKAGIDLGVDVIDDIGDLLQGQPGDGVRGAGDGDIEPRPTPPEHPVQGTVQGWCAVGEYNNQRSCLEITDQDKCLSGQIFPSKNACINPALTAKK